MLRHTTHIIIDDADTFKRQALRWADENFDTVCYFDNNHYKDYAHHSYECLIAAGAKSTLQLNYGKAFDSLKDFYESEKDWLFGFLGYDLKNEVENLRSRNHDGLHFPDIFFFQPEMVVEIFNKHAIVSSLTPAPSPLERGDQAVSLFLTKLSQKYFDSPLACPEKDSADTLSSGEGRGEARISESSYLETVRKIKDHIQRGDIYE